MSPVRLFFQYMVIVVESGPRFFVLNSFLRWRIAGNDLRCLFTDLCLAGCVCFMSAMAKASMNNNLVDMKAVPA
ncbi:hypothetical protein DMR_32810 [Solidesulfovibrio magneticus RS-1]|uniref:Uncharacterized protein n=1 Tax=Solidesulfovibrio magneticus (strain ATCC 700980 / DSM 13731 / RS-1) TaxID=573370 RepID=C4XJM5_SOLM1|nr:hypothetical protein DMR_32810 [Solidesulfovibrio magneticus RS-1]